VDCRLLKSLAPAACCAALSPEPRSKLGLKLHIRAVPIGTSIQVADEMILTKTERNQIYSRRLRVQIPELRELTEQVWSPLGRAVNVVLTWQCEKSLQ
jgi:hypothetical protein